MQEAPYCNFLNTNKKSREKVHQTYVGGGRYNAQYSYLIACKTKQ